MIVHENKTQEVVGMTAKEYLSQARNMQLRIKSMKAQLRTMKDIAEDISPKQNGTPRTTSPNVHKMESEIVRAIDLDKAIEIENAKFQEINDVIKKVTHPIRHAVLVNRYIKGESWAVTAININVSISRVYQIHTEALEDVDKIISHL